MKTLHPQTRNGECTPRAYSDKLFGELLNWGIPMTTFSEKSFTPSPAMNVIDDKDAITIALEAPGMKKENFNISWHDGVLSISGEKPASSQDPERVYLRRETYSGKFTRSVALNFAVKSTAISASYKDGVLTVSLPKSEEAKPRLIEVSGE